MVSAGAPHVTSAMDAAPPPAPGDGPLAPPAISAGAPPAISAMAVVPPPAPRDRSLAPPSIRERPDLLHGGVGRVDDVDGGDRQPETEGSGGKQQCKNIQRKKLKHNSLVPNITKVDVGCSGGTFARAGVYEALELRDGGSDYLGKGVMKASQMQGDVGDLHTKKVHQHYQNEPRKPRLKPILKKGRNSKGDLASGSKSATPRLQSPKVTSSTGINMLVRSPTLRRVSRKVGSASGASMGGSPETSQQSPSSTQLGSPSLDDLYPGTRTTRYHVSKRKRRKLISAIWQEAVPFYLDGKLAEGKCIHCHQIFPASRDSGTSHIKRHLKVCEAKTAMTEMVDKMGRPEGIDPNWKFDANVARQKLVKLIVVEEMPFSLVEYTPFREFTAALNPWFGKLSRTTIRNDCVDCFKEHSDILKEFFGNFDSRVSLTGDMWTSNQKLGYFCMTSHFISDKWVPQRFHLNLLLALVDA